MYGKAYESMYEGSMVGAGLNVFAVWNYCIAKNRLGVIELNPKLLAFILMGDQADDGVIRDAIKKLCEPDDESRSHDQAGRRLIKEGEYQYRMVNWGKYDAIKNADGLREYNRMKQREYRARSKSAPLPGEEKHVQNDENGVPNFDPGERGEQDVARRQAKNKGRTLGSGLL